MANEELKRIYDMFTDCWRLFKKYSDVKDSDEYWEAVINKSNVISKKYGECKFVINLVLAVITELERIYKEMRANAETQ